MRVEDPPRHQDLLALTNFFFSTCAQSMIIAGLYLLTAEPSSSPRFLRMVSSPLNHHYTTLLTLHPTNSTLTFRSHPQQINLTDILP